MIEQGRNTKVREVTIFLRTLSCSPLLLSRVSWSTPPNDNLNRSGRQQDSDPCSLPMDGGPCRALKPRFVKTLTSWPSHLYFVSFSDQSLIIALPCQSVTYSLLALDFDEPVGFSKLLNGFVKIDTWISLSCHLDFSKLIHGFLLHGFVKLFIRIC